jgi:hypothetical protein
MWRAVVAAGVAVLGAAGPVAAQRGAPTGVTRDTAAAAPPDTGRPVRLRPPLSGRRALLTSLAVPGLAQSQLDRGGTGALFALVEGIGLLMLQQSGRDRELARAFGRDSTVDTWVTGPDGQVIIDPTTGQPTPATWRVSRYTELRRAARTLHREDWIAVLIFNHIFAGADAFVAAQLWDLPATVGFAAAPRGLGVAARLRW